MKRNGRWDGHGGWHPPGPPPLRCPIMMGESIEWLCLERGTIEKGRVLNAQMSGHIQLFFVAFDFDIHWFFSSKEHPKYVRTITLTRDLIRFDNDDERDEGNRCSPSRFPQ